MADPNDYNPTRQPQGLLLSDAHLLLSNPFLPLESGVSGNSDGMTHVAASTAMRGVTPEMIDWWFGWFENTEQYKLWHPRDHVYSKWRGPDGKSRAESMGTYIGGSHYVHEYIGGKLQKLCISFKSPAEYFGPDWQAQFKKANVGTAICGRVGLWDDSNDAVMATGHLVHLCHKEWYGTRMRSRFWLGDLDGVTDPKVRKLAIKDKMANGLMQHASEEMAILATVLPDLYARETGKKHSKLA